MRKGGATRYAPVSEAMASGGACGLETEPEPEPEPDLEADVDNIGNVPEWPDSDSDSSE